MPANAPLAYSHDRENANLRRGPRERKKKIHSHPLTDSVQVCTIQGAEPGEGWARVRGSWTGNIFENSVVQKDGDPTS